MTTINTLHPETDDQKNLISDFFKMAKRIEVSENLLQKMQNELHYECKTDPTTNPLSKSIMETPTMTPETEVEVTKVEVKSETPEVTPEVIAKFCKAGKMLGLSPETIAELEKELTAKLPGAKKEEEKPATMEAPMEKKNLLADLLK